MTARVEHHTLRLNGIALHVVTAGDGDAPLLILLHGFPEHGEAWRRHIQPLVNGGWRVAVPDQRGYGASEKPTGVGSYVLDTLADDVMGIAHALSAPRFSLVGHDWGGIVAWHLAAREAASIERLVILNAPHPATFFSFVLSHPLQMLRSSYVGFFQLRWVPEAVLRANDFALLQAALTHSSRPGTFDEDQLAGYRAAWAQPGALRAMIDWYRAMPLAQPRIDQIEPPVRILWGDADTALEPGFAEAALHYCPTGEVVHLPRASHWLHHEEAQDVSSLLLDFLSASHAAEPPGRSAQRLHGR